MNTAFSFFDLNFAVNLQGIKCLAGSLISITVGAVVLLKNPRSRLNVSFFFMILMGFLWLFLYGFFVQSSDERTARILLQLTYLLAVPFISPSVYLFTVYFSEKKPNKNLILGAFISAAALAIWTCFWSDSIWKIEILSWGYFDVLNRTPLGWTMFTFVIGHFVLFGTLALQNVLTAYKNSKTPQEKVHRKLFLIGYFCGYIGSLDFGITIGLKIPPVGPIFFPLFCLIIAYSIIRHQFLDVKLVLKKISLIILIYSAMALLVIPLSISLLQQLSEQSNFNPVHVLLVLGILVGATLSLGPIIYAYVVRNSVWLRGTLATGLTHELKSPLGILQSTMDILREQATSGNYNPEKTKDYLDMAQKNLERLDMTVKGLLNVAKIQEQKVTVEKIETDLVTIVRYILDVQKPIADRKGITLRYSGPEKLMIQADPEKIEQAVSNIVSNALKFSEKGSIHADVTQENNQVRFSLKDEGPGLNPKDLAKIFDRFYQAKPNIKGSGIGLTIAKAWVEAHGGKIWAESEGEGKGTKLSFALPIN